jgi:hypothetical protein
MALQMSEADLAKFQIKHRTPKPYVVRRGDQDVIVRYRGVGADPIHDPFLRIDRLIWSRCLRIAGGEWDLDEGREVFSRQDVAEFRRALETAAGRIGTDQRADYKVFAEDPEARQMLDSLLMYLARGLAVGITRTGK